MGLAAANNYLLPLLKGLGASESEMGIALALGTASEFPILFFGYRLIRRFRADGLLLLTMAITGVRLVCLGAAPSPMWVLILQLFNGFTFAAMWMAGVSYADQNAPAGMSTTVQGLFGAMNFGVGNAVGGFIGGLVLGSLGNAAIFFLIGGLVLLLVGIALLLGWSAPVPQRNDDAGASLA
jgi:PPP family 3-phenylpropionic acid transporter